VTVREALDYVLQTFPGFWLYENCQSTGGHRIVHFDFVENTPSVAPPAIPLGRNVPTVCRIGWAGVARHRLAHFVLAELFARSCIANRTTRSISSQGAGFPVQISNCRAGCPILSRSLRKGRNLDFLARSANPAYDRPMAKAKKLDLENPAPMLDDEDEETLAAIDEGIQDTEAGRVVPAEKARELLPKWITASSTRKKR
jgi:predicted transcriptional regulator